MPPEPRGSRAGYGRSTHGLQERRGSSGIPFMNTSAKIPLLLFGLLLSGCLGDEVQDITTAYAKAPKLQEGYHLGSTYVLQRPLFVTKGGGWPNYAFTKPGDGIPTVEEWGRGVRKPQVLKVVTLLPAGAKLRVEKVIFLKAAGSGVSHATGMLRADGVDLLINPFTASDFLSVAPYGTLCVPDDRFLREEKE